MEHNTLKEYSTLSSHSLSNLPKKQVIHILKYWKYIGRTTKQSVLSDKQLQLMVSILKSDFCQIEPKWFYFVFEQKFSIFVLETQCQSHFQKQNLFSKEDKDNLQILFQIKSLLGLLLYFNSI